MRADGRPNTAVTWAGVRPRKCRPPIVKLASETTWSEVRGGAVAAAAVGSTTRNAAATATAISIVLIASQRSDGS